MQILINVPDIGFSVDIEDKFQDFFKRLEVETREHLVTGTSLLCGTYELETIEMFLDAFKEMRIIPNNPTNGDMVMAMLPDVIIEESEDTIHLKYPTVNSDPLFFVQVSKKWWNAPFKKEV